MVSTNTRTLVQLALAEDVGHGDVTSRCCVPEDTHAVGHIIARQQLVLSGLEVAEEVFRQVDSRIAFRSFHADGDALPKGERIATVQGPARSVLTAERTALNFLQTLSGTATLTRQYVELVDGTDAAIVDTRKTAPGMRSLAKAAVRAGGGHNHRIALDDGILIKDNHILAAGSVTQAVEAAKAGGGYLLRIEVECDSLTQVREALVAGADIILLDNMDLETLSQAVTLCRGRACTEASGGVNLQTVRTIAETGVNFISVGALTHSAPASDIALDFE